MHPERFELGFGSISSTSDIRSDWYWSIIGRLFVFCGQNGLFFAVNSFY